MSAWAVTMGAGVTMGSCMRRLPFHTEDRVGPKSITLTPEMAKHNSRVKDQYLHFLRRYTIINSIVYTLYITVINVYYKCKADRKEDMYIFIACHIKYNTYKTKREAYFTLDTTIYSI